MQDISKIDKNFEVKPLELGQETVFFNSLEEPFKIYGLILPQNEDDIFRRLPDDVAKSVSEGVANITVTTIDGGYTDVCVVTVKSKDVSKVIFIVFAKLAALDTTCCSSIEKFLKSVPLERIMDFNSLIDSLNGTFKSLNKSPI